MRTLRVVLEYDGTNFSGWQVQKGLPPQQTVQGAVQQAIERLTLERVRVRGASRTDAGVHARGQVAAFETSKERVPIVGFTRGLGQFLPKAVAVRRVEQAPPGWDPRRTSRGKHYRYTYWNDETPSALDRHRAWWVRGRLDLAAMRAAAALLLGTHDFEAFRSADCAAKHAVRTIYSLDVRPGPYRRVELDVVGNAFCRNMVRIFAGQLYEVGLGKVRPEAVADILESRDRTRAGMTAPPQGLCLEEVIYDERLPPRPEADADVDGEDDNDTSGGS